MRKRASEKCWNFNDGRFIEMACIEVRAERVKMSVNFDISQEYRKFWGTCKNEVRLHGTKDVLPLASKMYKCAQSYNLLISYTSIAMLGMFRKLPSPNVNSSVIVVQWSRNVLYLSILIYAVIEYTWFFVWLFTCYTI